MTQALTGAALAAVVAVCWLLGRPRRPLLRSTDTAAVAALNRSQIERVLESGSAGPSPEPPPPPEPAPCAWPGDARGRALLLRQLEQQFLRGGAARQQALAACGSWGDRAALPLIRRGLRDSDPVVVALAADAISAFRGRTSPAAVAQPAGKPPRNVSRTR